MGRNSPDREHVFAVIRVDGPLDANSAVEHRVTVKEIVRNLDIAKAEVDRLNCLNGQKDLQYFWQTTRLFDDGESFGTHRTEDSDS